VLALSENVNIVVLYTCIFLVIHVDLLLRSFCIVNERYVRLYSPDGSADPMTTLKFHSNHGPFTVSGASIPPTAMTQTSLSPSPFPLPSLPSLPSPGTGAEPPVAGVRGYPRKKMEIEIGFGAFWRIFVSKRQLSSVSLFVNKN